MKNNFIQNMRERAYLILIGLILFVGPTLNFAPDLMWHDLQRIGQIFMLVVVAIVIATRWRKALWVPWACLPKSSRWALGLGFAFGIVSTGLSAYPRFAGLEWATLCLLLSMAVLLAGQARLGGDHFDTWCTRLVVALAVVIALKVLMGYVAAVVEGISLDSILLFVGTFSNRRVFGQVASMMIPLLAFPLLAGGKSPSLRWSVFGLLAVWWMLAIASGTRGTWMALLVATVVMAVLALHASAGWLRIQASALTVGTLLFCFLFLLLPAWLGIDISLENRLSDISTLSGRNVLWASAWVQIKAHSWLGVGPMHLATLRSNYFGAHPHNAILQLAAEWGVPAALAFMYPVSIGLLGLIGRLRQKAAAPNMLLVCLTASLLSASAQSMVDGVTVIPYTQTFLVLVVGWALGVYFRDVTVTPVVNVTRFISLGIPVISMLALAALLNGIYPDIFNRAEATQAYVDAGNHFIQPRYWGVGWIP